MSNLSKTRGCLPIQDFAPAPQQNRVLCLLWLCAAACAAFGCASRFEKTLEQTGTENQAIISFGNPTSTSVLENGNTRREWVLDESEDVPGHYESRTQWIGRDSDGYPVTIPYSYYVPPHKAYYVCTLVIVTDFAGTIVEKRFQGNACDALPFVNVGPAGADGAAKKSTTDDKRADTEKDDRGRAVGRILRTGVR